MATKVGNIKGPKGDPGDGGGEGGGKPEIFVGTEEPDPADGYLLWVDTQDGQAPEPETE